ncbi:Alpha/Beta hydrolase protein [Cercophora scortea]|uniref:Alpha/Beta hydrolase protein n=1 Tax=Cercophora scortea TaxID=314031 RepID=A0AAE0M6R5_9PEZI|nr:Alpha/Beta hydrolase protein [Cercophora scortea]
MDTPIVTPFNIDIPEARLDALKKKLASAEIPDENPLLNSWDSGTPVSDIKRLVTYWKDGFDWRAAENELNALPQFTTKVHVNDDFGELDIHFVHKKSGRPGSIPLLFCHGWPGSFIEVKKILPLLTDPETGPAFDVVAPSLPNFGFSQGVTKPGFAVAQYATTFHNLMLKLGYEKYVTQGGDWGFFITRLMGIQYPAHCLASHMNLVSAEPPTFLKHPLLYLQSLLLPRNAQEKQGLARTQEFYDEMCGYFHQQSTRPATLGLALADSPVALLAWIYEKLHDWTDAYPWTDDEVLTWVSIYWFATAGPAAPARIYYEHAHSREKRRFARWAPRVKLGMSVFPRDVVILPGCWRKTLGPVVFERVHTEGGHFASWERPEVLVGDLREMFGERGGAYDVARVFGGDI